MEHQKCDVSLIENSRLKALTPPKPHESTGREGRPH